eukprot:NODE_725_length_4780_cov_0.211066.p1 type:complete len:1245 gc:universal NODE_725_length_4780_cov_0.211066:4420-686(-)
MQHLILPPMRPLKKVFSTAWKDKYSVFKMMINTDQIERAEMIFKEFRKSDNNQVNIQMYEDIVHGYIKSYEETKDRKNLYRALIHFRDCGKHPKIGKLSGKLTAIMARGLLFDPDAEDLLEFNSICELLKKDHIDLIKKESNATILDATPGLPFVGDTSKPVNRAPSILEEMLSDSVIEFAPKSTVDRLYSLCHEYGCLGKRPGYNSDFLNEAKSILEVYKSANLTSFNSPFQEMPTLGVHLLKDSISEFQKHVDEKTKKSKTLSLYDLFFLQTKLEEQCYSMNLDMIEKKQDVLQDIKGTQDYDISTSFKVSSELKKLITVWSSDLEQHLQEYIKSFGGKESAKDLVVMNSTKSRRKFHESLLNCGLSPNDLQSDKPISINILPLVLLLKPKEYSAITILETIKSLQSETSDKVETDSTKEMFNTIDEIKTNHSVFALTSYLALKIGDQVIRQHNVNRMKEFKNKVNQDPKLEMESHILENWTAKDNRGFDSLLYRLHSTCNVPLYKNDIVMDNDNTLSESFLRLDKSIVIQLGAFLLDSLIKVAKINIPSTEEGKESLSNAIYSSYIFGAGNRKAIVRVHPYLNSIIMNSNVIQAMDVETLPMIVPPKPWRSWKFGGYLTSQSPIMRTGINCSEQISYVKEASLNNRLEHVFESLNVLGKTPWVINQPIVDIAAEIWNSGSGIADFPELVNVNDKFEANTAAESLKDVEAKRKESTERYLFNKYKRETFSLRCSLNYRLEVANRFRNFTLYFPHNVDFRGRAYPIPSYLNHINSDFSRGLLKFRDKKPLTETGWKWLKVHLSNVYGYDKASNSDRNMFAEEHMEDILDSANNPLKGKRWWLTAEDPWQCLATSLEIRDAIKSGNPSTYESNFPVHQDGSCNGLQHYAAIGGDEKGAELVNLKPQAKPADVYTMCANNVRKLVKADALNVKSKNHKLAKFMLDKINRKLVKQTVMTVVYGVTKIGARGQVEHKIKDSKYDHFDSDVSPFHLSVYIVDKLFLSIGELFSNANKIQKWLKEASAIISKSMHVDLLLEKSIITCRQARDFKDCVENSNMDFVSFQINLKLTSQQLALIRDCCTSVIWTAPNGLTCVQPYKSSPKKIISTVLSSFSIENPELAAKVNTRKQAMAFSPNFIHSVDASHMMMTAVECDKKKMAFAAVHDSYWTHAADIEDMNEILRKCFIKLHAVDIAQKLRQEFVERYRYNLSFDKKKSKFTNLVIPPIPERGSFKVDQVMDSDYFFH